ncbi:hypothetical protein TKK_0010134 [Trichogramma kaykai]
MILSERQDILEQQPKILSKRQGIFSVPTLQYKMNTVTAVDIPKAPTHVNASQEVIIVNDSNPSVPSEPTAPSKPTDPIVVELDDIALEVLGEDPSKPQPAKNSVREEVIVRWSNWIVNGLGDKLADNFFEKYESVPELKAQQLNDEFLCFLSDKHNRRDSYFVNTQNIAAAALSAIGLVISSLLADTTIKNRKFILETLLDAGKIVSHLHFGQLSGRKACIIPLVKKNLRHIFEKLKSDSYLFGKDLSHEIKKSMGESKNFLFAHKDNEFSQQKHNNYKKFHSSRPSFKRNVSQKDQKPYRKSTNTKTKYSKTQPNRRFGQHPK